LGSRQVKPLQWADHAAKRIEQQTALDGHALSIPRLAREVEERHAAWAGLNTATTGSDEDRDVIHLTGDQATHQPPEFSGQYLWLSIASAQDIARLD
jgi:hypothetical protein